MASHPDDAVLPGEELSSSSSSQDEDEDDVVDDEEDDDEELENDDDDTALPSSTSSAAPPNPVVTVALPAPPPPKAEPPMILNATVIADPSNPDRRVIVAPNDAASAAQPEEKKPAAALDDSRKLFQRLWTDEDEIELLQGFLDYTAQRGKTTHHGQNDTALFYDQIKSKLQLDFNKNQLVEKLRRLKKKYRNVLNKISLGKEFSFKSPHDQATFEISRKIWSNIGNISAAADDNALEDDDPNPNSNANFNVEVVKGEDAGGFSAEKKMPPRSRKRSRSKSDASTDERRCFSDGPATVKENCNNSGGNNQSNHSNGNVQGLIEETVRSCLSPMFKELLSNAMGGPCAAATRCFGGLALNPIPLNFGVPTMNFGIGQVGDERWRKQLILELEVYSKRLELVQDEIKAALDELRSRGGS